MSASAPAGAGTRARAHPPGPLRQSAQRRSVQRQLLMSIAVAILVVFSLSGLVYRELWLATGRDLTRLLPQTVLAYATAPTPWASLRRAAGLERWRGPGQVAEALDARAYLEPDQGGELGGIPVDLVAETLRAADEVSFAVVPTEVGPAALVFVQIREPRKRKRIQSRLQPLLEPVARHVGYRIEAVRQSPWRRYAGLPPTAPTVTEMDDRLIFAWGPIEALEAVLEARVAGERAALRRRSGLEGFTASLAGDDLGAIVDPGAVWRVLRLPSGDGRDGPRLIDGLDVATIRARMEDGRERLDVGLRLHEAQAAERLALALSDAPHELLALAPADAPWVVSLHSERPLTTLTALRTLAQQVASEVDAPSPLPAVAERLSAIELEALVRLDFELEAAFAGELAVMALPAATKAPKGDGWALVARPARPDRAEQTLAWLLPHILGRDKVYGEVFDERGAALHLVRRVGAQGRGQELLAWRVTADGLLEVAPTASHLDTLHTAWRSRRSYGDSETLARALVDLPDELAIVAVLHPDLVAAAGGPASALVMERVQPDFRVAVGLDVELPWLRIQSNLGVWSYAITLATADGDALDRLTLTGLSQECLRAHRAMCLRWPKAVPCRPLTLGRRAQIQAACDKRAAKRRGPGGAANEATP